MGHSHNHGHDHGHTHTHNANKKALLLAFLLTTGFMLAEAVGGYVTNSLALLSDAGHMLSDAVSLGLSLLAFKIGEKRPTSEKTYGYKRIEILAALFNGIALIIISIYILIEAIRRFRESVEVAGVGMLSIAIVGLLINIGAAFILMRGDTSENLNLRSAFLHVLGDLLGSVGAIVAALLILFFGWEVADPIASILVSILVIVSGWRVTKDTLHILMEGKPHNVNLEAIRNSLATIPSVRNVHDLHVWAVTSDFPTLTCHITVEQGTNTQRVLGEATKRIREQFHIKHVTIQIEDTEHCHNEDHCHT
ncbi:cation diffusion facilitator family transporter [Ectobacillus funiculus]|uniref:cation diffusion facilitator family transporter n=1 Tax=Ectobacillus funiculus TaxID=137993 RepID=UPI00397AC9D0